MRLFGRFNPINAKLSVQLDKSTFVEGEPVTGKLLLNSDEAVHADEMRVEVRITETYQTPVWRHVGGRVHQTTETRVNLLHSENVRVCGPFDVTKGHAEAFPFSVNLPPVRPTMPNGIIERKIKGVLAVKGRPDKTQEVRVSVTYAPYGPAAAPAPSPVVVKEVIKVPCKYCGALIPVEAGRCSNCGAQLRR
ncbi:MAG: sporulation protein [Desulfitobacteriaceae bacterium]|nr:sporulation protein [Desulfitobacteriaceae bacterium]